MSHCKLDIKKKPCIYYLTGASTDNVIININIYELLPENFKHFIKLTFTEYSVHQ